MSSTRDAVDAFLPRRCLAYATGLLSGGSTVIVRRGTEVLAYGFERRFCVKPPPSFFITTATLRTVCVGL